MPPLKRVANGIVRRARRVLPKEKISQIQRGIVPERPISIRNTPVFGNWCTFYAREVATRMGVRYQLAPNAWELAKANRSVWKTPGDRDTGFIPKLKPGQIVGVWTGRQPKGKQQKEYTHVALYMGTRSGQHYFMHRVGMRNHLDSLSTLIGKKGWEIREIIEPKGGL